MGAINYSNVFTIGADQHFACLDDGQSSSPGFACVNCAPMYGKYATTMTHVPDIETWFVGSPGSRKYAGWGKDYYNVVGGYGDIKRCWNQGAFVLIEIATQRSMTVSVYGFDGSLINNNVEQEQVTITSVSGDVITASAATLATDAYIGYMMEFVNHSEQYIITDNDATRLESSGEDFTGYTGVVKIYARPYIGKDKTSSDYLGQLTMSLSDSTYYLCNETFETTEGSGILDGCDEAWTLATG